MGGAMKRKRKNLGLVFYVYEHWRPDKDLPFYVGKGRGSRAESITRNVYYNRVVNKLSRLGMCVEIRMVESGLSERAAFDLEVARIALWRQSGVSLTNITNGGEGLSGLTHSEKTREKIRAARKLQKPYTRSAALRKKLRLKFAGRKPSEATCVAVTLSNRLRVFSSETRKKMSIASASRTYPPRPLEWCAKISAANKNPSAETRAKMSASAKKRRASAETRAKISASLMGRVCSDETRMKLSEARRRVVLRKQVLADG